MRVLFAVCGFMLACAVAPLAMAHAFPTRSIPAVGATLAQAPHTVKVWFDGELEPVFSTLVVKDAAGEAVGAGKGEVAGKDHTLLEATLPTTLAAGKYTVYWSVAAHDGHRTAGHFAFTVK